MDPAHETAQRAELSKEALRIMEDTEHSGAQHFAAGQRWRKRATRLGLPTTILIAATSTGAGLSALVGGLPWITAGLHRLILHVPDDDPVVQEADGRDLPRTERRPWPALTPGSRCLQPDN